MWESYASIEGVFNINLMCHPFKVAHLVVVFVAIDVVHFWKAIRIRYECQRDFSMHLAALGFAIHMNHEGMISMVLYGVWHDPDFVTLQASHSPLITHFVVSVGAVDWSPSCLVCRAIHRCSAELDLSM